MITVALPDYLRFGVPSTVRMFRAPFSIRRWIGCSPCESSNPRCPGRPGPADASPSRVQEVASRTTNAVVLAVIEGAAAINFSHRGS